MGACSTRGLPGECNTHIPQKGVRATHLPHPSAAASLLSESPPWQAPNSTLTSAQLAVVGAGLGFAASLTGDIAGSISTVSATIYPLVSEFSRLFGRTQFFTSTYVFEQASDIVLCEGDQIHKSPPDTGLFPPPLSGQLS